MTGLHMTDARAEGLTERIAVLEQRLAERDRELELLSVAHTDACALILDRLGPDVLAEHLSVEVLPTP